MQQLLALAPCTTSEPLEQLRSDETSEVTKSDSARLGNVFQRA